MCVLHAYVYVACVCCMRMCMLHAACVFVCLRAGSDKNDTDGIVDGHAYSLIAVKKNVRTLLRVLWCHRVPV